MKYLAIFGVLAAPAIATAHIQLVDPLPRTAMQKEQHCGDPTAPRKPPLVLKPGAKLLVKWLETIDHPGHFRISFNPNGDTFFIPPNTTATTVGMDPTVLVDLIADVQGGAFPPAGRPYEKEITLPNMECTNCTLQVIQLMTDKPPYTTNAASDDIYFQCADIQLSNAAPDAGAGSGSGSNPGGGDAGTMDPGTTGGGCSTGSGAGLGAALALIALRRRAAR